jgi:hypothetical protein
MKTPKLSPNCPQLLNPITAENQFPEWYSVAEAMTYSRFSKGLLYSLMNRGLIKSVSLRERGMVKGKRIISVDSLRSFLNSRASGGHPDKTATAPSA